MIAVGERRPQYRTGFHGKYSVGEREFIGRSRAGLVDGALLKGDLI